MDRTVPGLGTGRGGAAPESEGTYAVELATGGGRAGGLDHGPCLVTGDVDGGGNNAPTASTLANWPATYVARGGEGRGPGPLHPFD
jgi:hypothetical protein